MKNDYEGMEPFAISDRLMTDSHDLVLKRIWLDVESLIANKSQLRKKIFDKKLQ